MKRKSKNKTFGILTRLAFASVTLGAVLLDTRDRCITTRPKGQTRIIKSYDLVLSISRLYKKGNPDSSQLVLIWAEQKQVYLADLEIREYVTCMESVSADGRTIDPMIIFLGAHYLEKHFDDDLNDDALFAQSELGYANDYLSYRWLMHWERSTRPQNPEENRLLIMDGYGSHLTLEFINYCDAHKLFPFLLPPHSTHLLQPHDIGIFQQYKHYHQELLADEIRIDGLQFNKKDFFRVLQRMRNLASKKRTITFAFKQAGLVPCDSGVLLDKMNEFSHPERPCTPPPREINWKECVTPTGNIAEVQRGQTNTPSVTRTLYKRDKASMALMLDGKLAVKELHDKMAKETAKKARMSGMRVVQAYGVIYAGDARLRIMQRNKDDIEKEEAAMEARLKIYENRFKRIVKSFKSKKNKGLQERSEIGEGGI
ncbi:hypothetical protein K3495_g6076 [Podosphaera aphanis]|nr:hypothetical protein K3495_g6076 [Podosphaera aphanis]